MSIKKCVLQLAIVCVVAGGSMAHNSVAAQSASTQPMEITDSKLGPVNMGLDAAQHWLDRMKHGDVQRGQKLINDLERLATRFKRIPASNDAQYLYVANRFAQLATDTIAKANQQPSVAQTQPSATPAIISAPQKTQENAPAVMAAPKPHRNLSMIHASLAQISQQLARFSVDDIVEAQALTEKLQYAKRLYQEVPQSSHPDHMAVTRLLQSVSAEYNNKVPHWTSAQDPNEFLAQMNRRYREERPLPEIRQMMKAQELTSEDVQYYLGSLDALYADLETDLPEIIAAVITTRSRRDLSLVDWLQQRVPAAIETTAGQLQQSIDTLVERAITDASRLAALDPQKNRYQFVTESVRTRHEQSFERALRTIENAAALESLWQQTGRWSSRVAELNEHISGFREKVAQASTVDKLPDDIGDATLAQIATDVLAIPKYGVGQIERLIVNSKKVPRDKVSSRWINNRLETTVRVWEEFQVCTVETENGTHVVYFNTLRRFSRGAATTPIDTWIVADRFKTGEISAAKLN